MCCRCRHPKDAIYPTSSILEEACSSRLLRPLSPALGFRLWPATIATVLSATQLWPASTGLSLSSLPPRRSTAPHPLATGSLFLPAKFRIDRQQHSWSALTCQRFRRRRRVAALPRQMLSQR